MISTINALRKNQQRNDLRATQSSKCSTRRFCAATGPVRETVRSDRQTPRPIRGQVRSLGSTCSLLRRQDRRHPYFVEQQTGCQHISNECRDFSGRSVFDHFLRVTQSATPPLKHFALAGALLMIPLAACAPEVQFQEETHPTDHITSEVALEPQYSRTRADCRVLTIREERRACMEEVIATIEAETRQIRTDTEVLRAENERLDVEIEHRIDELEASALEDAEARKPD